MIYDCFMFYNEFDILDIRLHELESVVDRWVLVECTETWKGVSKPLWFAENKHRFSNYLDRITHVIVADTPDTSAEPNISNVVGLRQGFQRNSIMRGLIDCKDDDIIMVSDVDEVPKATTVQVVKPGNRILSFMQKLYYYYLNTYFEDFFWSELSITSYGTLKTLSPHYLKYSSRQWRRVPDGGWHFSYVGGANIVQEKIKAYIPELDRPEMGMEHFQKCVSELRGFHRNRNLHKRVMKVEDMSNLPKYVQDNQDRFKDFLK